MSTQRYLVLHDYGMGGLWWWIRAGSVREVRETFAEVEVVDDPAAVARAEGWGLDEVDIGAATLPAGLDDLRATRVEQRALPGFGALADRQVLFLRQVGDDEPVTYLMEVGPDGRRIRQVEVAEDGTGIRSDADDWLMNPPVVDLFDPRLPDREIDREEFERVWAAARWESGR
ncbi:hypothetical protein ACIA5A_19500 [Micromonospora sp. NPDC051300]|uniref:hypothetical protein n=1 Tax=Micromonospora sp. NPDC051300 TaxID=3364286 RepID=UPI003789FEC8